MGEMFSSYVAGWDEYEKARVYCVLQTAGRYMYIWTYMYFLEYTHKHQVYK